MLLSDFCVLKQVLRKLGEKIYIIFIDFIKKQFFHNKKKRGRNIEQSYLQRNINLMCRYQ